MTRCCFCSVLIGLICPALTDLARVQPDRAGGDRFDLWDKNHDGKLTRDELPERIRQNFDRSVPQDDASELGYGNWVLGLQCGVRPEI